MAGIPHPYFDWDNSIPDFLAQLRLDLQNWGIDPNNNAGGPPTERDNAIGHLRACIRGRTLEWFDDEITTKQNWELTNLLDNTGQANLVAQSGNAIVKLRAVEDAWNEDWRIADGCPTNDPVNAPNANAGNTVVVAGIRFGQAIWWLKTHFSTGDMTIDELYRKILQISRQASYRPEELHKKFLDALPLPWLEKAEDIEKQKSDFQSQMAQQVSTPQTVELVRQLKGVFSKEEFDSDYPVKNFQRLHSQQNNNSAKFNKIEKGLDETRDASYFKPFTPINFQNTLPDSDKKNGDNNEEENRWYDLPKANKPSDFTIKGNSKHITKSLGWFTDVPINIKDKNGMTWIRKVQGILDPNKNQFKMKLYRKSYTILIYSKTLVAKDLSKEDQDQLEEQLLKTERWLDMILNAGNILAEKCSQLIENRLDA
ncbi:20553_t:CDS:2 [Cetraspora pellucida]|uniref:20553_t:CDS:1 n=1 Tax=Cetraspora pellucida TaxID=1433469 RepID=A0A9N9DX37_9GLOM|nr:20553_t:CDS:2 [Cetraspora pellucida]